MVRKSVAGWVVAAVVFSGTAQGRSVETTARRIAVRVVAGRLLIVPVMVDGTGPYPFLLDTGATCSLVDEELADLLQLPRGGKVRHESAVASRSAELVHATLTLGGVGREGEIIRARLDALADLEPAPRGVVGQDLLRLGNWWLDYRGASLVEDADGAFDATDLGERLRVHWHDGRPAIDAVLPDQSRLRFVLDSAASSPVLFRPRGPDDPTAHPESGVLTTVDGPAAVALFSVGPFRAGRASIPRMQAAVLSEMPGPRAEDGLLPTGLFQGIYFDNRAGSVVLNPRRSFLSAVR